MTELFWAEIAKEARRVADETMGDKAWAGCLQTATAAWLIAHGATGRKYHLQVGMLRLRPDPSDPELSIRFGERGSDLSQTGAYHAWIADPTSNLVVDPSSARYLDLLEKAGLVGDEPRPAWKRPAPPGVLIVRLGPPIVAPDWVRLTPDDAMTEAGLRLAGAWTKQRHVAKAIAEAGERLPAWCKTRKRNRAS